MIKTILLLIFIPLISIGQSWKYDSGGNAFDGKYRSAHVIGKCSDFPYNNPGLFLNIFEEKDMNLYIANSGYYSSEDDVEILFVFNNEPNTIYYSYEISLSKDNGTIFLSSFKSDTSNYISRMDFINKLKKSSKLDVRIKSSYKNRDLNFSMSGSTKAINYVITKKYLDYVSKIQDEVKSIVRETQIRLDSINKAEEIHKIEEEKSFKKIDSILSLMEFEESEKNKIVSKLKSKAHLNSFNLSDISKIETGRYESLERTQFSLYSNNNKLINQFTLDLPNYYERLINQEKRKDKLNKVKDSLKKKEVEKKQFETSKKNLLRIIQKYNFSEKINKSVINKYEKAFKEEWFDFKNIDSVNILKAQKKGNVLMRLYFNNYWIVSLNNIDVSDEYKKKMKANKSY